MNGRTVKPTDMVFCIIQMAISMKANGSMTKLTVMESILTKMVPDTKATGSMTSSMARGPNRGPMAPLTRENIIKARRMEKAASYSLMEACLKV